MNTMSSGKLSALSFEEIESDGSRRPKCREQLWPRKADCRTTSSPTTRLAEPCLCCPALWLAAYQHPWATRLVINRLFRMAIDT